MKKQLLLIFLISCLCSQSFSRAFESQCRSIMDRPTAEDRVRAFYEAVDQDTLVRGSLPGFMRFIDELAQYAAHSHDTYLASYVDFVRHLAPTIFESSLDRRIEVYKDVLSYYAKYSNRAFQATCLHFIAQERFVNGEYSLAFEYIMQSQELFEEIGFSNIPDIGRYLHDWSLNYYYFRDYAKVKELMQQSLRYPAYNPNLDIQRHNTLALACQQLGMLDSAIHYFEIAVERAVYYEDITWIANASGNRGAVLMEMGKYDEAIEDLRLDYIINKDNTIFPHMGRNAALSLAEAFLTLGRLDSASFYLRQSEYIQALETVQNRFGNQQRDEKYMHSRYSILHRYHAYLGEYAKAYLYLDSLAQVDKELDNRYNSLIADKAESKLRIQQYLSDMELEKQRRKTAVGWWVAIAGGIGLIAIILGLLFYLHRTKVAKERLKNLLNEQQLKIEKEQAEAAFEKSKNDLKSQLSLLEEKNTIIDRLAEMVDMMQKQKDVPPDKLEEAKAKLSEARLLTHEDWVVFRRQFNQLFGGVLDHLKQDYPGLTKAEERIYALSKLTIDTKQMAQMLGISPESVRKSKYRLRKKIDRCDI